MHRINSHDMVVRKMWEKCKKQRKKKPEGVKRCVCNLVTSFTAITKDQRLQYEIMKSVNNYLDQELNILIYLINN